MGSEANGAIMHNQVILIVLTVAASAGALWAQPKNKEPIPFSDAAVQQAIERGIEYLRKQQKPDGRWSAGGERDKAYPTGGTAIATYALLASGVSAQDEQVSKGLTFLAEKPSEKTYSLGLRCQAFYLASRQNAKWLAPLRRDVEVLVTSTQDGSYGYDAKGDGKSKGDNSCSQYGLLGVWGGAQANLEIPKDYWWAVIKHWNSTQHADGGWGYNPKGATTATMVTAGAASLYVCFDNLFFDGFGNCNVQAEFAPIERSLNWLDRNFEMTMDPRAKLGNGGHYYYLYGVERVALASGLKYFGKADWYKMGAQYMLNEQKEDGSWSGKYGDVVSTSYALLFLIRGQHAVLFNKLQFDGDWNNRPRDMATLSRWIGRTFETTVNWQVINLKAPVREWHDAPILYLSGSNQLDLSDEDIAKLRQFVWQGGTILSVTECDGGVFRRKIRDAYKKMFPEYELTPVPGTHELYSLHFTLAGKPKLEMISNGIRPLVIHTDEDLAKDWQLQRMALGKNSFDVAANIFLYITDKSLRSRGVSLWPEQPTGVEPTKTAKLVRVAHAGNANPEPLAHERLSRLLLRDFKLKLDVTGPVEAAKLPESGAQIATLTGTGAFKLSAADQAGLKQFVAGGGLLVIDVAGGAFGGGKAFAQSAEAMIDELFGREHLRPMSGLSPLFQMEGAKIEQVRYRRLTRKKLGGSKAPNLQAIVGPDGKPRVIYSTEDLTAGLVGYPSHGLDGYDSGAGEQDLGSAYEIMRNIVLSVAKEVPGTAANAPAQEKDGDAGPAEKRGGN